MSDELLPHYNRELSFLRRQAAQFARENPKIATRLKLGESEAQDPHVERLIQAFAFTSARVRQKLDDEFPEITEALLGVLYPHYHVPVPSMGIVQMSLPPDQTDLPTGYPVPAGTPLETEPIDEQPCRFRTTSAVTLWPVQVQSAALGRPPMPVPSTPRSADAAAVLRLVLHCPGDGGSFKTLALGSLRFFLEGQSQHVYLLYKLIFNHALEVVLAGSPTDPERVVFDPAKCLNPVGFAPDEGILPYGPRSFPGYRILTEFFAFPEKFLFAEFRGLLGKLPRAVNDRLFVYLFLNEAAPDLEQYVSARTFRLGCTPVVNLYRQPAEPIDLSHTEYEYRVVPDARRPRAHEIYTIDRVIASSGSGEEVEYHPFFSVKHGQAHPHPTFWQASRRPAVAEDGQTADLGTEVYLSLVDLDMRPSFAGGWRLHVETTCLNRDLPSRLPYGGDQPRLQIPEGASLVSRVSSLTRFTRTLRPAGKRGALWRLISHLTLNHLSLVDGDEQGDALREILKLYDFADNEQTRKIIGGLKGVRGRRVVGRVGGSTLCRGVEVAVTFGEADYTGNELFLFATVLERFLGLYCTMNSFTKMVARVKGKSGEKELRQWPPRVGQRVLI
jgi:type VI secretion system protein ImpG